MSRPVITIEVDISGDGTWVVTDKVPVAFGTTYNHVFPDEFSAYWIRFTADKDVKATAQLSYR